jgi:hypothetical protein
MHIVKTPAGWFKGQQGPFKTKHEAQMSESKIEEKVEIKEKKQGKLTFALDYHKTYSADPKFWNVFIELVALRKDTLYCVTHSTDPDELKDLYDSIGKVIGKKMVIETKGKAKKPFCDANGINIDIWIDNNPLHIIENPPAE